MAQEVRFGDGDVETPDNDHIIKMIILVRGTLKHLCIKEGTLKHLFLKDFFNC